MNILQIGSVPPPYGGVATTCCETSKHLTTLGYRVFLLTLVSKEEYTRLNGEVDYEILFPMEYNLIRKLAEAILFLFRCLVTFDPFVYKCIYWVIYQRNPLFILGWLYNASYAYKMSKSNKIDVIMGHHASSRGLIALLVGEILKIQSRVFLYGGAIFDEIKNKRKGRLIQGILKSGDNFFSNCQNTTERALELGVSSDKVITLGVGIDASNYPLANGAKSVSKKFAIGFVGYLSPHRGLKEMFMAISRIKEQIPSISLTIVGRDPDNYWKELEFIRRELGIEKQVEYVGSVSHEHYLKLLSNFEVGAFLIQDRITASMLGALEFQAMGIPVLTTGLGGMKEVVCDGKTGIICQQDVDSIGEGLLRVYDYYQKGLWDRNVIREWALRFSWSDIAQRISSDVSPPYAI